MYKSQEQAPSVGYSATPQKRRGPRRATGGSSIGGPEPQLAGLSAPVEPEERAENNSRDEWMKEQRPPHYGGN